MIWIMLTHGDKITDDNFKYNLLNEIYVLVYLFSLNSNPYCVIDKRLSLIQIMAWGRTGAKPLSKPTTTQSNDAYVQL